MTETTTLPPRRAKRRWLKPLIIVVVLLTAGLGLAVGWLEWKTARARSGFLAHRAMLQSAGDPVAPSDLRARPPVPDGKNAAIPLRRAASRTVNLNERDDDALTNLPFLLPLSDRETKLMDRLLADIDEIIVDIRAAEKRPQSDWATQYDKPMIAMLHPDWRAQGHLAKVLELSAVRSLERGDLDEAARRAALQLTLARGLRQYKGIVSYLISYMSEERGLLRLADVAGRATVLQKPLDRAQTQRLMGRLADSSGLLEGVQDALRADRVMLLESMELVVTGEMPIENEPGMQEKASIYLSRPHYWRAGTQISSEFSQAIQAAAAPDWPTALAALPVVNLVDVHPAEKMLRLMTPSYENVVAMHFRQLAQRRLAIAALATHLYAADHDWKRPALLDDLVPNYLPAVPADPFAGAGRTIQYVNDSERPLVYSIGQDQIGDGGLKEGRTSGDVVMMLTMRPRPAPTYEQDESLEEYNE